MKPGNWEDTVEVVLLAPQTVNTLDKIGDLVGLYMKTGAIGDTVPFKIAGRIYNATKITGAGDVWAAGDRLYYVSGTKSFTKVANGTAPVACAAAAAANAAVIGDIILLGGAYIIAGEPVVIQVPLTAAFVATWAFIADRAYQVISCKEVHSVVGGAAAAMRPRKITDTSAPGAVAGATVKELTQAVFDCTAVINTIQTGTLSATLSDLQLAAGDKIAVNPSGTLTGLVGYLEIILEPLA